MLKLVFISDTHNRHKKISLPDGDILFHVGDATGVGDQWEVESFGKWFRNQPHKYKFYTPGNHERSSENQPEDFIKWLGFDSVENCFYIHNQTIEVEGLKIFMSGCTPTFGSTWAWNVNRGTDIKKVWDLIEEGTNVVCTHGPCYEILDSVEETYWEDGEVKAFERHVGCQDLLETIQKINPMIHTCGHIHGAKGQKMVDKTLFIKASVCTEEYKPTNKPIVVEIENIEGEWKVVRTYD